MTPMQERTEDTQQLQRGRSSRCRSDLSLIGTPGARRLTYGPVMLSTQLPVAPL